MSENAITRRSFLAGSAGVVTLAASAGFLSFEAWAQTNADTETKDATRTTHTLCNACSSKCGYTAYVVNGRLTKLIGDPEHPYAQGRLCARGYGYSQIAYSEDRLTDPLKRNDDGTFAAISWDQAYSEIADKVNSILGSDGPRALAMVQDPRPSGKYYASRFINALGSANLYTHATACNLSKVSGFTQVIGAGDYVSDVENAAMTLFIGRSYCDAIRPDLVAKIEAAHEAGSHIVIVDPRCNATRLFADEWLPINPGTDLALVLALSQVLTTKRLYDADYIAANTVGFDEWARAIKDYTPAWAEEITGIPAETISRLAFEFADAAPAASIDSGWRGAFGCAYQNSGETARAICAFNTLLGCWNQKGGALLLPAVNPGPLDEEMFPPTPPIKDKQLGLDQYPLASPSIGPVLYVAEQAKDGNVKGMFFYNSNMAAGYSNTAYLSDALSQLELMVVIDVQMSETAMLADYVLPDTSYLERLEIPEFLPGKTPCVALRDQVLDVIHPNTKPVDQIFSELAAACGIGDYFAFTVEDLAEAELASVGLTLSGLQDTGTAYFPTKAFAYGTMPKWNTPTGKIQFASDAVAAAGLSAVPVWVDPQTNPTGDELRLIGGKQPIHSHTQTANIEDLMQITEDYDLTAVWINAGLADSMGIKYGDTVEVSNNEHTGTVHAKVTERINPTALYMPSHYGCSSPYEHTAYGIGLRQMDFVPFHMEPGYGSSMTQEAIVRVKKVGE